MNTVGLFAGRGDVILAMGLALLVGGFLGWKLRGLAFKARKRVFGE
jgi:hypothetical protein